MPSRDQPFVELAPELATSFPLTNWPRIPPPSPAPARFPWIRFALIVTFPAPGLIVIPAAFAMAASPPTKMPPPPGVVDWSNVWLKMTVLWSMTPLLLKPRWPMPPPEPFE